MRATETDLQDYLKNVSAKRRAARKPAGKITLAELLTKGKQGTSATKTQSRVIRFIEQNGGTAWRQNSLARKGYVKAVRGSGEGISDVVGYLPFIHPSGLRVCVPVYIEAKTTDSLKPNQVTFLTAAHNAGAVAMVCRSYEEFVTKFRSRFMDLFGFECEFIF